ncbi:hypothetical protein P691DRAFT_800974 [Macrolepiota fuliginosa MF-IS2]|uniref:Uncharacterized protein n=1 Tax=Macrolepiota fuliginosa MF-IS2 TaxID=1400762 RepID=A0A9P6C434_9AGAR|nr:hypothetical protein P691DRAFT_800974 [Macrolepiota fuliginosa MF-IS2]
MSSTIAPCTQIPPAPLSHYQTSHLLRFGPSLPVEQRVDSRSLLLGHAPAPSSHSTHRTDAQVISEPVQLPTSSRPNSMFQSAQPSFPPSVYPEQYGSASVYAGPSTQTPLRHGAPELPAVSDGGYTSTVCGYPVRMDDPYFGGSPEAIGETLMLWEAHDSLEAHAGSPPDSESAYAAPQLTSPANQRAATARRKRTAKYSCNMCGSKLTAKHNLISKSYVRNYSVRI